MAEAQKKVDTIYRRKSSALVAKLGFQGEMLKFLQEEEKDVAFIHLQGAQRSDGLVRQSGYKHPGDT